MRLNLLAALLFPFMLFASSETAIWVEETGESIFNSGQLYDISSDSAVQAGAMSHILHTINELDGEAKPMLTQFRKSPLGYHLNYTTTYKGLQIYGTDIKLNIATDGKILSMFYKTASPAGFTRTAHKAEPNISKILRFTGDNYVFKTDKVWYYSGREMIPAFKIEYSSDEMNGHNELVVDTAYAILYSRNKSLNVGSDSLVRAHVFLPDPLTSAKTVYKNQTPFSDNGDADNPSLNQQRRPVDIRVLYDGTKFSLEGPYAQIVDIIAPNTPLNTSDNTLFDFNRSEKGFEEVNAYYHISHYQEYVQLLGFDSLGNSPLRIDAHAGTADQSSFEFYNNDLKLYFGDGGVDDAEDADVIIHEYGHFLSFSASGDNVAGKERAILEEALCDYLACSYSRSISEYNWQKLFNWDGNETWNGRSCTTNKIYPADMTADKDRYSNTDIWAGAIMDVADGIGLERADRNMLGMLYMLSSNISLADAAKLYVQTDSLLGGNENSWKMNAALYNRGLLPKSWASVEDANKAEDVKILTQDIYGNEVSIKLSSPARGTAILYNVQGKELGTTRFNSSEINLSATGDLASGIYFLNISTVDFNKTVKILKED